MRLGTNRKIFSLAIAEVPWPLWALTEGANSVPAWVQIHSPARRISHAHCAQVPAGSQMFKLAAGRGMGRPSCAPGAGGAPTPPFLWADAGLFLPRGSCRLQLRRLLLQLRSASGTYFPTFVLAKLEKGTRDLRNGCVPFKICPLPFPFLPSAPFHRFVPKYRGRRGGKESSTLSKGRNLKGEVKRERGLGKCLYFLFCGGYYSWT